MNEFKGSCPCGLGAPYLACCGRFHQAHCAQYLKASTPEALMRSRFCAFALGLHDYLLGTWHPTTRPASLEPDAQTRWKQLSIEHTGVTGEAGTVTFTARFVVNRQWHALHETSRFVLLNQQWFYLDGDPRWMTLPTGRNDPCLCASGKKAKKCCLV